MEVDKNVTMWIQIPVVRVKAKVKPSEQEETVSRENAGIDKGTMLS